MTDEDRREFKHWMQTVVIEACTEAVLNEMHARIDHLIEQRVSVVYQQQIVDRNQELVDTLKRVIAMLTIPIWKPNEQ